ncbi:MAG: hypothetical protein ABSB12_03820 [Candidatus Saccharimonadales bacterium]|jgi:uncharacterized membrane-anchored protein
MLDSINYHRAMRKVPEITLIFWVVKLLSTAMGEATSDFFVFKINPYIAVILGGIVLAVALLIQFSVKHYIPWVYWFAVVMVAVFGTMAADALHIQLGVPYVISTLLFSVCLVIVFIAWYKTEHTLSIHSINTKRRELFYWATVLATFALGTAAGDMTATTLGLGYFTSALMFSGLIAIPTIGYWLFKLNEVAAFWIAYILTRPIGASFADWMSKSKLVGGLGWGNGHVGIELSLIIIVFVGYMTFSRREARRERIPLHQ